MPLTFTVDHVNRTILVQATGVITAADIHRHLDEERREAGLAYGELIDARGCVPGFSSEEVRQIVARLRGASAESPLGPTAVLVDNDVGFGMMRMLQFIAEDVAAIRPFRDLADAMAWLPQGRLRT